VLSLKALACSCVNGGSAALAVLTIPMLPNATKIPMDMNAVRTLIRFFDDIIAVSKESVLYKVFACKIFIYDLNMYWFLIK
jgi:hypothetical protein